MTKLYFHATNNAQAGLPTVEQSSLTVDNNGDVANKNRLMDDTAGTAENTIDCGSSATTSAQVLHFTRFCSKPFSNTSISANTWNYVFGAEQDNVNANFPCSGSGKDIWVTVYVWNPNTQTKVGNIIDGLTSSGTFQEPSASASPIVVSGSFSGSAVASIPSGCVIVYECMFQITHNNATARTLTFHYDGPTVDTTGGDSFSNNAAYIETPQTLTFQTNAVKAITSTVTIGTVAPTRKKNSIKPIATTVNSSTASLTRLATKKRTVADTVAILSTPVQILSHHKNVAPPAETITIGATAPTQLRSRVRVITTTITISSTPTYIQVPNRPFRRLIENILINSTVIKKSVKIRNLLN